MAEYLTLLGEFSALDPPLFVFGSVAEAALLNRKLNESHGDIDVVIPRTQLELRLRQLDELGFAEVTVYYEPRPGLPLVYGSTRDDLALELSCLDYDSLGNPFFVVSTEAGPAAISMPRNLFQWPATIVDEVPIHTLSPLALVHIRAGATATAAFGPPRPDRDIVQARLIERFFRDTDPNELAPAITPIRNAE